jgi:hypothetical protein
MSQPDQPKFLPTGPPVAAPARIRRRRTGFIIAGIIAVVFVVAAGVGVVLVLNRARLTVSTPTPTPTATSTTSATAAPTSTQSSDYTGALQALVAPKPAGATDADHSGAADGTLTKQQVVSEYNGTSADNQAAVLHALTELEFQRGLFVAWRDRQGTLVYVQLYQFRFDREAASWSTQMQRGMGDDPGKAATAYFDEIEGGRWFANELSDGRGAAHAIYSKGQFAVMIDVFRSGASDIDDTKKLAIQQYGRLP